MKYATYSDFGTPNRKEVIRIHLSEESAKKGLPELKKNYGKNNAKVWQEPFEVSVALQDRGIPSPQSPRQEFDGLGMS